MATKWRAKIVFFFLPFLLVNGDVDGKEVDVDGEEMEGDLSQNEALVLDFPFDRNNSNTFASTSFIAQEDIADLTMCFAFMVNALKSAKSDEMQLLQLQDSDGETVAEIIFTVEFSKETFYNTSFSFFDRSGNSTDFDQPPFALMTWMQSCFSLRKGTITSALNGVELDAQVVDLEGNIIRKGNLTLHLGKNLTGGITQVNMFSPALSMEDMINATEPKGEYCGQEGNLISWKELSKRTGVIDTKPIYWILHGKANNISQKKGPCAQTQSRVTVFKSEYQSFFDCMEHCQKLGGKSPSIKTLDELEMLTNELWTIVPETYDKSILCWLSVTQGKIVDNKLLNFDHWPQDLEARVGVWRDYYTGQQVDNDTKPWSEDYSEGDSCVTLSLWVEEPLELYYYYDSKICIDIFEPAWCPCSTDQAKQMPPLLLRGLCSSSNLRTKDFTRGLWYSLHQLITNFQQISYVGGMSTRIDYNKANNKWILRDVVSNTRAESLAIEESYVLGKQKWTIKNDNQRCHEEKDQGLEEYKTELKLSGCNQGFVFDYGGNMLLTEDGQFTCDDGQCVSMKYRCDHLPHCKDKSDEKGCNLLTLTEGYNKIVPPFSRTKSRTIIPVSVNVSLRLLSVMGIDEDENTIDLQFEIILDWRDYRISYSNLKNETFLNSLTKEEIQSIWLPLVIYDNTNQKESTKLSWNHEWRTSIIVAREGNFTR